MSNQTQMKVFNIVIDSHLAKTSGYMADLAKRISSTGVVVAEVNKQLINLIKTSDIKDRFIMLRLEVYSDKTFKLLVHRNAGTSRMILTELGLEKGAKNPGHGNHIATITTEQIKQIALKKMVDMSLNIDKNSLSFEKDLQSAMKMVKGTTQSMHIKVID